MPKMNKIKTAKRRGRLVTDAAEIARIVAQGKYNEALPIPIWTRNADGSIWIEIKETP